MSERPIAPEERSHKVTFRVTEEHAAALDRLADLTGSRQKAMDHLLEVLRLQIKMGGIEL